MPGFGSTLDNNFHDGFFWEPGSRTPTLMKDQVTLFLAHRLGTGRQKHDFGQKGKNWGLNLTMYFGYLYFLECLGFQINDVLPAPCRRYSYQSPTACHFAYTLGEIWPTAGLWFPIWGLSKYNCTFVQYSTPDRLMSSQYSSYWISVIRRALCNYLMLTELTHKRPYQINEAFVNIISQ